MSKMIPFTGRQGDRFILLVLHGDALLIVRREHPLKDPHQACLYHPTHRGSYKFLAFPPAFWLGGVFLCCVCLFLSLGCQRPPSTCCILRLGPVVAQEAECGRWAGEERCKPRQRNKQTQHKKAPLRQKSGGKLRICTTLRGWDGTGMPLDGVLRGCSRCTISKK